MLGRAFNVNFKTKRIAQFHQGYSIKINDDYTLFLKYPTIDEFIKITSFETNDPLASYFVMVSCLDSVASEDEVHEFRNYSQKEIDDFMENVAGDVVKGIQKFFETMPKLSHEIKVKNPKTGKSSMVVLEGLASFFA